MPPLKEPLQCIPANLIKDQVDRKAFNIQLDASDISMETWNRYPCKMDDPKKCQNDHCCGNVSFFVSDKAVKDIKILTLLFSREDKNAYVCLNRQLRSLFDDRILAPVAPVTIQLNPPVIPEPVIRQFEIHHR